MALVNAYITMEDLRGRAGISDHDDDGTLEPAINAACRAIDLHVGYFFYDSGSASALTFEPRDAYCVDVFPFSTTSGLVVATDDNGDATFETTWTSADYELVRVGGNYSTLFGATAYNRIRGVARTFPTGVARTLTVQVTARWGFSAVPEPVKEAAKILSVDLWKRKDTPFGIQTGTVDFSGLRVSRNMMEQLQSLLGPYRPSLVG
jgi:hypothetical protein